ncbi:MAG: hypothetical protein AAF495_27565 [Pseudomonadota bacterium]
MPFLEKWKAAAADRNSNQQAQCAKDLLLAASFVRSLECADHQANHEIRQIAERLDRLARRIDPPSDKKAA